jgi:nitrate reductase molybdenum cofactor assembly chaperone NarJ/NarW
MSRSTPPELFQIASLLLRYPTAKLLAADPEITAAVAKLPGADTRTHLDRFLSQRRGMALIDLEREYVETFDTRRRCTLNISYYLYGDTRRRGISLLRLKRMYKAAFAASGYGEHVLQEHRIGLELLRLALRADQRPHLDVLDAVCSALPRIGLRESDAISRLVAEGPPDEQVGLEPFAPPEVMPAQARI